MVGKKSDEEFLLEAMGEQNEWTIDELDRETAWGYARTYRTLMRLKMKGKVDNLNGRGSRSRPGKYIIAEPRECPMCGRTDGHIHTIE